MPNRRLNVFLCHAKEDKPTVRELYRKLVAEGWLDLWLDEENLFPGQEWDVEIEKAVEQADVVVTCLSTHSVDKEGYVQKELRFVLNIADEKPEGTLFVIPLRLDDCAVPRRLRSWQYADYFPKEEHARAYARLLVSLRMRARRLDIPTVNPAEEQARKEAEEKARIEQEERERKAAEQQVRREAEKRARLEAEEKARKEKEEKDRKAAEEKSRLQAEHRAKQEREAKEKKEDQVKAVGTVANIRPAAGVGYSLFPEKSVESPLGAEPSRSPVAPSRAPATHKDKPTASKPDFRLWLVLGGLFVVILCGFGINYLIQNWPAAPAPTQTSEVSETSEVFTASPTFTAAPPIEPPTRIPTIPFTPEPGVGDTWISPKDGMVMMFVPAGKFSMGSDSGSDDEKPIHNVTLDSYWIDKTEVTNAMYAKCMQAGECDQPSGTTYFNNSEYADHPIVYVSWNNSQAYCDWRGDGTRLPTEAEWEKAASWDDDKKEKRVYPWGDSISCSFANYSGCIGDTAKVGNYPSGASFYGLLDMAGNVWEWVADWYDGYPGNTTSNSSFGTQYRVLRGGSWYYNDNDVRSSVRDRNDPASTDVNFGFRCARSLP